MRSNIYLVLFVFFSIYLQPFLSYAGWSVSLIDGGQAYTGLYPSIKIGQDETWHISYLNCFSPNQETAAQRTFYTYVRYLAVRQGEVIADWTPDIFESQLIAGPGNYLDLDVDLQGRPHIVYCDSSSASLKYAHFDGDAWDKQVLIAGEAGPFVSLALDSQGQPHVACYAQDALQYLTKNQDAWHAAAVDSSSAAGTYCSLALDHSDTPHIAYYDESDGSLSYATLAGDAWQTATINGFFNIGQYASLACDADGAPHVAYYNQGLRAMQYATPDDSGAWRTYFVAVNFIEVMQGFMTPGSGASHCSLALDSRGMPHISYYNAALNRIVYAQPEPDTLFRWQLPIPFDEASGPYSCLILDDNDNPCIAFFFDSTGE